MNQIDEDFVQFCRHATDSQLENILMDEWKAHEHRDYASAKEAAKERGWIVSNGKRQGD